MPQRISKHTLYLNSDRSKVVKEGDPDAAFLLVREGSAVNESEVARLEKAGVKVNLSTDEAPDFDARAAHEAEHGTNESRAAAAKAQAAPAENKAVAAPAANKAKE